MLNAFGANRVQITISLFLYLGFIIIIVTFCRILRLGFDKLNIMRVNDDHMRDSSCVSVIRHIQSGDNVCYWEAYLSLYHFVHKKH